jgi:hypothetical protein
LKALVGGLGLLVVLGTALVIGVVIKRMYAGPALASNVADVAPPVPGYLAAAPPVSGAVTLPAGSKITGLAASGDDFAVSVSGPAGDRLWIVNARTGAYYVMMSTYK